MAKDYQPENVNHNPANTDGFEFLEYVAEDPELLRELFAQMGFHKVGQHKTHNVELWRQGDVNFLINAEPNSFASEFAKKHGPSVCGMCFRVKDAKHAYQHCLTQGAQAYQAKAHDWCHNLKTIYGIGDNLLYFNDRYQNDEFYRENFAIDEQALQKAKAQAKFGYIDHVTHNVYRGNMDKWADFYSNLFNFRQIRYFDIEGKLTGLVSRAMTSPCGKIRIPINESSDDKSQIEEYLRAYQGEGIQHIALSTDNIYETVEALRQLEVRFLDTPNTYYEKVDERLPGHGESVARMRDLKILIDGAPTPEGGRLLQIFTETVIGPVFFEIIQRKGDEGFGEGNFRALFESIELDQIRRGVLSDD